jgi:hypothetical protein
MPRRADSALIICRFSIIYGFSITYGAESHVTLRTEASYVEGFASLVVLDGGHGGEA